MTRTPLSMLPASPTTMAVRCQSACIASAGSDMGAWARWDSNMVRWMSHPQFDLAEFHRLCRIYKLD